MCKRLENFESNKESIAVNVLFAKDDKEEIRPAYTSKLKFQ